MLSLRVNWTDRLRKPDVSRVALAARSCSGNRGCVRWPHRRMAFPASPGRLHSTAIRVSVYLIRDARGAATGSIVA